MEVDTTATEVTSPTVQGRRGRTKLASGYLWILPAMAVSAGIIYYSIGYTGLMSLLEWDGLSPNPEFVGLANYAELFRDRLFYLTIWHTVVFFGVTFIIQNTLGLLFAIILHSKVYLATVYKVIIFVPVVLAPAIMAPVFRQVFAADGQFNAILEFVGLETLTHPWLADASTAMPVIMFITIWQWTGLTFLLYYAAMGQIEPEILEAAQIDGAGKVRIVTDIIWPMVRRTTVALLLLAIIGALKIFDVPWLVTLGGPNFATEFLGTYIYRESIPLANVGYASALSVMLLVIALSLAIPVGLHSWRKDA